MAKSASAAKPKAPKVAVKAPKEKKERVTIGSVAEKAILAKKDNDGVIAAIREKFPNASTTAAAVNWYRTKLRKEGHDVASTRLPKPKAEKVVKAKGKPGRPAGKTKKAASDDAGF